MQFIDLKAQYRALKEEINANIQTVLDSAAFIGGPQVKELEGKLLLNFDCVGLGNHFMLVQVTQPLERQSWERLIGI